MSKNYTIALQGLALGEHHFEFALANDLFLLHETSPLLSGTGRAEVALVRHAHYIDLAVEIEAEVEVECDRCMDPYREWIEFEGQVVVREGEGEDEQEAGAGKAGAGKGGAGKGGAGGVGKEQQDDVLWINEGAKEIDLSQWLYESVVLSLPIQRIHPDRADCNEEVTKYIQE